MGWRLRTSIVLNPCPLYIFNRVEILDYFRKQIEDGRHVIFSAHRQVCLFILQVTASIGPRESRAEATGGHAPAIGEASSHLSGGQAVL